MKRILFCTLLVIYGIKSYGAVVSGAGADEKDSVKKNAHTLPNHPEKPGQPVVLDEVAAVVGDDVILMSDVESQLVQYKDISSTKTSVARCLVIDQLMQKKLLLNRAKADSLKINDEQVEGELNRRMEFFTQQYGSEDAIEKYYHKTIREIKDGFRDEVKNQLLEEQEQSKIVTDVNPTPEEIKKFYRSIPTDSLPYYNTEYEIGQILMFPHPTKQDNDEVINKLMQIRADVLSGKASFGTEAILYSADDASAIKQGDLGMQRADNYVPEFSAAALALRKDSISMPVKTKYGYHIIQMIERKGDMIHVRHILIRQTISIKSIDSTKKFLDSIRSVVMAGKKDSLFSAFAYKYSEDEETKNRGGLMVDMKTNSSHIPVDELDAVTFDAIDRLKIGEISRPIYYKSKLDGKEGYRLVYLKSKNAPHKANLADDYPKIKQMAQDDKKAKALNTWIKKYVPITYIRISDSYKGCKNLEKWQGGATAKGN